MTTETISPGNQPLESQDESTGRSLILDVFVTQPGATCNVYQHDRERGALRLKQVLQVDKAQPADLARFPLEHPQSALERIGKQGRSMPASASEEERALPVLLVRSVAIAPGAWVSARLIGALRVSPGGDESLMGGWTLLAVPVADASQQHIVAYTQLSATQRMDLATMIAGQGHLEDGTPALSSHTVEWLAATEAAQQVRQARAAWRQLQRQRQMQAPTSAGPREHLRFGKRGAEPEQRVAWRAIEGVTPQQIREQGLGAYAEAEYLLRFVPQRFQQYLDELLFDDERVLCFLERPRLRKSRGLLGWGARYLKEGLLLCTDRQVLWLRDVAASDATLVPWGYVARSVPVERLAGVHLVPAGQAHAALGLVASPWVRLVIQSAAAQGTVSLVIEFPESALPALQRAAELLERFLPFPRGSLQAVADRRVRRVPEVSVWQPHADEQEWLRQLGGLVSPAERQRLEEALTRTLHPGETVLAQALAPALSDYPGGPRLLALTRDRLIFGQTTDASKRQRSGSEPSTTMKSVPLERVAAVQLRRSLLGCLFEVFVPEPDGQATQPFVPFNSPGAVPFRAIYHRTRLLLAGSYEGRPAHEPELHAEAS